MKASWHCGNAKQYFCIDAQFYTCLNPAAHVVSAPPSPSYPNAVIRPRYSRFMRNAAAMQLYEHALQQLMSRQGQASTMSGAHSHCHASSLQCQLYRMNASKKPKQWQSSCCTSQADSLTSQQADLQLSGGQNLLHVTKATNFLHACCTLLRSPVSDTLKRDLPTPSPAPPNQLVLGEAERDCCCTGLPKGVAN